jgi:predicted alpha/beta hydrolase
MKYAVKMGSGAHDIHTEFYKDWARYSKVDREDTQTHRQHGDRISLLLFFQNKASRLGR